MAANKPGKAEILAAFFDDGTYSPLFTDGAVSAAYGCANGQNAYVVFEDGSPVGVQDIEKNIRVLEMAAETGAPVVTFYDSTGAKLEGGLDLLNANARLTAEIARVSGVVPQVAVVTGICAGTNAINAAAADVCVMAEDAELFLNAPFNAEDKVANAGSAAFAAKAGVAAVTAADAVAAAKQAASIVALLPANNLAGPALFDFAAPSKALDLVKYSAADAIAALADEAVGPAYTVFAACADWRVAVQGCTVAPLAPEAAVTVLYKDEIFASDNIVNATKAKAAAYAKEVCSANAAVANGAADAIADAATARGAVAQALDMLASKRTVRLAKKHGNITL